MKINIYRAYWCGFTLLLTSILAIAISLRPENLTADYEIYSIMYYDPERRSGEIIFQFLRWITSGFDNGFIILLFIHCFISLFLKFNSLYRLDRFNLIYFILFYFAAFLPLWEMSQIRVCLAISFYFFAILRCKGWMKWLFVLLAFLTHSSIIFIILPLLIYDFISRKLYVFLLICFPIAIVSKYIILFTSYSVYDSSSYSGYYTFLSLKNLLLIFLIYYCWFVDKSNIYYIKLNCCISLSIIVFSIVLGGQFPAVAIRITDIATFLMISGFIFLPNNRINFLLKFVIITLVVLFYGYMNFFSDTAVFNMKVFQFLFSNLAIW